LAAAASRLASLTHDAFNVIRFSTRRPEIAFLCYPAFFTDPFPVLRASWLVRLSTGQIAYSDFSTQDNPPILHRKELLLPAAHPARTQSERLTAILDDLQAFDFAPHLIGRRDHWSEVLASVGIRIDGDQVVRVSAANGHRTSVTVARHRTAISRSRLSAPMQSLARWGFLDTSLTVLDYGCGRGDDVSALAAAGIDVIGWDPHFAPEARLIESDIVNLGYVLNVIESPSERAEALVSAYRLTRRVLSIAVMINGNGNGAGHADGVLTKWQPSNAITRSRNYASMSLKRWDEIRSLLLPASCLSFAWTMTSRPSSPAGSDQLQCQIPPFGNDEMSTFRLKLTLTFQFAAPIETSHEQGCEAAGSIPIACFG
jgi:hypothetical protein